MKFSYIVLVGMLFSLVVLACDKKPTAESTETVSDLDEWPGLDEFHSIMADVYHPLEDSGNVGPIMERAEELANAADKWALAPLPQRVNTEEMKTLLNNLKKGSHSLADGVKMGVSEEKVSAGLSELHTLFHHIQEAWYGGVKKKGDQHHH